MRRIRRLPGFRAAFVLVGLLLGQGACQITAAVAANVRYAMEEIKADFRRRSGVEVKAIYGSSGKLTAQIRNGAPFDVLVSADMEYPDSLRAWGYAQAAPRPYAYGKLVLWSLKDLDLSRGLDALEESAGRIAVADPERAPYGRESVRALRAAGLYDKLRGRLVLGESISQVSQYVLLGNVDAGFIAKSMVLAPETAGKGKWVEVDSALYRPIAQGAVVSKYGSDNHPALAQSFLDFLYSPSARTIFSRYGYSLP